MQSWIRLACGFQDWDLGRSRFCWLYAGPWFACLGQGPGLLSSRLQSAWQFLRGKKKEPRAVTRFCISATVTLMLSSNRSSGEGEGEGEGEVLSFPWSGSSRPSCPKCVYLCLWLARCLYTVCTHGKHLLETADSHHQPPSAADCILSACIKGLLC